MKQGPVLIKKEFGVWIIHLSMKHLQSHAFTYRHAYWYDEIHISLNFVSRFWRVTNREGVRSNLPPWVLHKLKPWSSPLAWHSIAILLYIQRDYHTNVMHKDGVLSVCMCVWWSITKNNWSYWVGFFAWPWSTYLNKTGIFPFDILLLFKMASLIENATAWFAERFFIFKSII